jgi:hypothetical protein
VLIPAKMVAIIAYLRGAATRVGGMRLGWGPVKSLLRTLIMMAAIVAPILTFPSATIWTSAVNSLLVVFGSFALGLVLVSVIRD